MKLKKLIASLNGYRSESNLYDFEVKGITCNSKQVLEDFVFVAVKGPNTDGHNFIKEAVQKGAQAVIIQGSAERVAGNEKAIFISVEDTRKALAELSAEFYGNPSQKIKVIGITGTNGKTTVSYLLEALLKEAKFTPAVIGTINYRFKDTTVPSWNTTPGIVELQSMLARMLQDGASHAIIEVSSHALDQERTSGINFNCAIFTNLTQDHLDYHQTSENYFSAKAKLFTDIGPLAFAVINNDDPHATRIRELTKAEIITYGIVSNAEVIAKNIKFDIAHTEFTLLADNKESTFKTSLIGRHNVYNILAAIAWGLRAGLDFSIIKSAMEKFDFVPGRLERIDFGKNFVVFVDYAHTEDALYNVITALRPLSTGRLIVVFGCGGERDKTKRPKMGRVVSELADYSVITSDNPRSEDPQDITEDIKRGITKDNYCVVLDRKEAIKRALSLAGQGDIVLVAGKGHERYQVLKDKMLHFDDREVIKEFNPSPSRP